MSSPLVLLVGGRLTSGKDAFADHLVENHDFVKLGMSDTLAEALYRLDPWIDRSNEDSNLSWFERIVSKFSSRVFNRSLNSLERYQVIVDEVGYVEAKKNSEVRRLLQVLGTEVGRELLGENIWVEAAKKKIQEQLDAGKNVVVTGIRFPNELELSQEFFSGEPVNSIYIDRPSLPPVDGNSPQHASEGSLSSQDFDWVLRNEKDLPHLYRTADRLLGMIRAEYA